MKKLLFFAVMNGVRKGGVMHEHYQKYLQRDMTKTKALIAIARKLLCVIFARVRDHRNYVNNFTGKQNTLKDAA